MATIKSEYHRWNGLTWDLHYFKTTADMIVETTKYKVMESTEREAISTYLGEFNKANKLVKLNEDVKVDEALLPDLTDTYLSKNGGSLTGDLSLPGLDALSVETDNLFAYGIGLKAGNPLSYFNVDVGDISFNDGRLMLVGAPKDGTDAANKDYVDGLVAVGTKPVASVKVATTANISLSGEVGIDGYTLKSGDRVLVWKQTTPSQNGIYKVATGAWTKVTEDSGQGAYVFVENGNVHNDWYFFCTNQEGTWISHGRPDTVKPGSGLEKSGTTIGIKESGVTDAMLAGAIDWTKLKPLTGGLPYYQNGWAEIPYRGVAGQNVDLTSLLASLETAIRLLRGTTNYYDSNTETIKGAYNLANTKIKTTVGSGDAPTSNNVVGDLFFKTLASS